MIINIAKTIITSDRINWLNLLCLMLISLFVSAGLVNNAHAQKFDHDETLFPLDIVHAREKCDACHIQGVFKGTPTQCSGCHSNSGRIQASAPSAKHMRTTDDCEFCHQTGNWENVVRVDHFAVTGECQGCHNGIVAVGKHPGHIQSSDVCDNCHRTNSWHDAVFDHEGITGNCQLCHNGVIATPKNTNHILTTDNCEDCHTTVTFDPVYKVDHISVIGTCSSCHNNILAEGKPATHMPTVLGCESCHTTISWSNSTWIHDNVTDNCESCHNGVSAVTKSATHFVTSESCETCHTTISWAPSTFSHSSADYPAGRHDSLACDNCHINNIETNVWRFPAYEPECAACHADKYDSGEHESVPVATNADCGNSGCHSVNDPDWDN